MTARIQVEAHLSSDELYARFRTEGRGSEKTHWQVLWLISQGKTSTEVAATTGYSLIWVRKLVQRYNRSGPEAMHDGRRENPGHVPLLSPAQREELATALKGKAPSNGLWSGPEVARWMAAKLGRPVSPQRGWLYLRGAGYTPQVPRPRHAKADPEAQEAFQARSAGARRRGAAGASGSDP